MKEYPEIDSVFKRDEKTHKFIEGEFSRPEFEYLFYNNWIWTEKVNGTNMRIEWVAGINCVKVGGKTDNAQVPPFLLEKVNQIFSIKAGYSYQTSEKFKILYPETSMILYGEGYGARIQKGGGNYIPNGVDFVLFDVLIDDWWLKREDVEDIALKLGVKAVPIVGSGTLFDAIKAVQNGFKSSWGDFLAEGMVLRPRIELKDRAGKRIVTKLKHKDFENGTDNSRGASPVV